jgi:hypothetical protein
MNNKKNPKLKNTPKSLIDNRREKYLKEQKKRLHATLSPQSRKDEDRVEADELNEKGVVGAKEFVEHDDGEVDDGEVDDGEFEADELNEEDEVGAKEFVEHDDGEVDDGEFDVDELNEEDVVGAKEFVEHDDGDEFYDEDDELTEKDDGKFDVDGDEDSFEVDKLTEKDDGKFDVDVPDEKGVVGSKKIGEDEEYKVRTFNLELNILKLFYTPDSETTTASTPKDYMLYKLEKKYPMIKRETWLRLLNKYKPYDVKKQILFFKKIWEDPYFELFYTSSSPSLVHVTTASQFTGAIDLMVNDLLKNLTSSELSEHASCLRFVHEYLKSICREAGEHKLNLIDRIKYFMGYPPDTFESVTPRTCSRRKDATIIHDQKNIGNCTFMVMTSFTIKLIELLYICNTNGRLLGTIQIINIDFLSDIFTVTNFLIMQSLPTHDLQTKYLYMIAKKNYTNPHDSGYSFEQFYTYIYIFFYLFMYILTILDDYSKDISSCTEMKCRLTYRESCTSESVVNRGTDFIEELQFYEKLKTEVFITLPSSLIRQRISYIPHCIEAKIKEGINEDEAIRVCNDIALKSIPDEVLRILLDPLFRCIFRNYSFEYEGYRYSSKKSRWEKFKSDDKNPSKAVYLKIQNDTFSPTIPKIDSGESSTHKVRFPTGINGCILMYKYLMRICSTNKYKLLPISVGIELGQIENHLYDDPTNSAANYTVFLAAISNIPSYNANSTAWEYSWENLVKIGDIHASHSMVIIFNSVTNIAVTRNNWKDCATHLEIDENLFGWLVSNGFIPEFSFFRINCNGESLMGGKKTKIKSNKRRSNKRRSNKRRSNKRKSNKRRSNKRRSNKRKSNKRRSNKR